MPKRFWAFDEGDPVTRQPNTLRLDGPIAEESWWGDEVTPAQFRADLENHPGDLVVYINSPGGDVVAGSMIYSMLREHSGRITVRIDGLAASAASVVAMAGDRVEMAPTAYMMIHNAATIAMGDNRAMRQAADMLDEVNRGIRTAYALKTGMSDRELAKMMDAETWMSAAKAVELGFCDAISYAESVDAAREESDTAQAAASANAATVAHISCNSAAASSAMGAAADAVSFLAKTLHIPAAAGSTARSIAPAVAFSARAMQNATAMAAMRQAQAKEPENETKGEAAVRARLRLLSM